MSWVHDHFKLQEPTYSWCITKDYLEKAGSKESSEGTVGPHNAEFTADEIKNHKKSQHFKIYDDDMNLYFDGYLLHGETTEGSESSGFEPLDDYGNAFGAVHIKYRDPKTNKYEFL